MTVRTNKHRAWVVVLVAMTLLAAACGPSSGSDTTTTEEGAGASTTEASVTTTSEPGTDTTASAAGGEPVTITWLNLIFWDTTELVKQFEAANPDIKVEVESVPFEELSQQIQIRLSSGTETPDLISVDGPLTASYGVRGWLAPLDDLFSAGDLADFVPGAVEAGTYNGHLIAAPQSTSTQMLYVNLDLFEAAGITPPGPDDRWTYEQIAEAGTQLTGGDTYGFSWEQTEAIYQLGPLPASLGGQMIGDDGLTVDGVINSDVWVQAFTFYSDVFNTLAIGPRAQGVTAVDAFIAGDLAMLVGGEWQVRALPEVDFSWSVSRHPYFEAGDIVTPTGAWHIGVNANSKNVEAAARFAHWISTGEGAQEWFKIAGFNLPAQLSVQATFETDEYADEPLVFLRTAAEESRVNPVNRALSPGFLEYDSLLRNTFADIRNGADVKEALDAAVARIDTEMEKYR